MGQVRHGESPALYRDQNYDLAANLRNLEAEPSTHVRGFERSGPSAI